MSDFADTVTKEAETNIIYVTKGVCRMVNIRKSSIVNITKMLNLLHM